MKNILDQCLQKAYEVIEKNIISQYIYASPTYRQIWTRDVAISAIALRFCEKPRITSVLKNTLNFIGNFQSDRGQIPTYIDLEKRRLYWYSIDSTLWWLIACLLYDCIDEKSLVNAYNWCYSQVLDESMLITSMRGTDWMDASLGREGKVLYINVLWYQVAKLMYRKGLADVDPYEIKSRINTLFWPTRLSPEKAIEWGAVGSAEFLRDFIMKDRKHYIHFVSYEYLDDRFDSLANILAILFGVADKEKSERILRYIEHEEIDKPYPIKNLYPPVYTPGVIWLIEVDIFRRRSQRCLPYHYHNGGIWPFIGALYVGALATYDRKKALEKLEYVAEANRVGVNEWEFNEWLHGVTGKPMGSKYQLWNAATYVYAYLVTVQGADPQDFFELE